MITDPQPGESVYDPTCGSGGYPAQQRFASQRAEERIPDTETLRTGA